MSQHDHKKCYGAMFPSILPAEAGASEPLFGEGLLTLPAGATVRRPQHNREHDQQDALSSNP